MSIRKRRWNSGGLDKEAWVVDYNDPAGTRRLKTFRLKKEADVFAATTAVEVRQGVHVADGATIDVAEAGRLWLKSGGAARPRAHHPRSARAASEPAHQSVRRVCKAQQDHRALYWILAGATPRRGPFPRHDQASNDQPRQHLGRCARTRAGCQERSARTVARKIKHEEGRTPSQSEAADGHRHSN